MEVQLAEMGDRDWNWPEIRRRAAGLESKFLSWMTLTSYNERQAH